MQKWEYLRLDITFAENTARLTTDLDLTRTLAVELPELVNSLDNLGNQNWELVSVSRSGQHEIHYFKRPMP